jgi:hypothetical protein
MWKLCKIFWICLKWALGIAMVQWVIKFTLNKLSQIETVVQPVEKSNKCRCTRKVK